MFGCFPLVGFGFTGGCCGVRRPIMPCAPFFAPIPFGRCCFGPNVAFAGNPFFFGRPHPFIQDNLTLQGKLLHKLGLIG